MFSRYHPGQPEKTLPPLPSLLHKIFFSSVESQELVSPGKGGVKEMPVQNDSIIYCIKYTKPQKEQNLLTFI